MWIDYSRDRPTMSGQYFVRVKNNEDPIILEYDVQYKDFGYSFSYGQWESFSSDPNDILYWHKIVYPVFPDVSPDEKTVLTWQKDKSDETGLRYRYYSKTEQKQ